MKRKDLGLIAVVIIISTAFALVMSSFIIGSPTKNPQEVEVVDPISTNFPPVQKRYFNSNAIDPTQVIVIGESGNADPFAGGSSQ